MGPEAIAVPGSLWSKEERDKVVAWLTEDRSLEDLLLLAALNLPRSATTEDCEDVVQTFMAKSLDLVLISFDPTRPGAAGVWTYICICLKRFCWKRGAELQERHSREVSIDGSPSSDNVRRALELPDRDLEHNPEQQLLAFERDERKRKELRTALKALSFEEQMLVEEHHLDGRSIADLAAKLGKSKGSIKVELFRARQKLIRSLGGDKR